MLRACSLGWWSIARPTSPHFKHIYPTFSKLWRTPHHPLHMALMANIQSEWTYLQFLEPRNALETSSTLICPTEKLLLCLKQKHCSSLSLTFSLFCCQKRCSFWTTQQHDTSNFLPFFFSPKASSHWPSPKSTGCNFPGHSPVSMPHLPTVSQHLKELLAGYKAHKFSFY